MASRADGEAIPCYRPGGGRFVGAACPTRPVAGDCFAVSAASKKQPVFMRVLTAEPATIWTRDRAVVSSLRCSARAVKRLAMTGHARYGGVPNAAQQSHAPQTHAPQTHAPQTHAPQTHAPQTHAPQTHAPQTHAPQSHSPLAANRSPLAAN